MNEIIPSGVFRARARKAIQANVHVAILITFVALLPTLVQSAAQTIFQQPLMDVYQQFEVNYRNTGVQPDMGAMYAQMAASLGKKEGIAGACMLVMFFIAPFMELGWNACLLRLLRGEPLELRDVFCRKNCFFKSIGLVLLKMLKIFLWAIPGLVCIPVFTAGYALTENGLFMDFVIVAVFVSVILMVRAFLHYCMAEYTLADHPEMRLRDCIRQSIVIMRHRKLENIMLELSFFGWVLLISLITMLLTSSPILALTVRMALTIPLDLYMNTAYCAFYQQYC